MVDEDNGKTTSLPVSYSWDNEDEGEVNPGGLLNLGFTGLMTNKTSNYASLFDSSNMTAGGAAGVMTVDKVPAGSASSNSATLTLSGVQTFAWVSTRSANRGQAEFRIDGSVEEVSDLYSSTTQWRRVADAENRLDPSVSHTVEVRLLGTKNAASSGTRADLDAFVVLTST